MFGKRNTTDPRLAASAVEQRTTVALVPQIAPQVSDPGRTPISVVGTWRPAGLGAIEPAPHRDAGRAASLDGHRLAALGQSYYETKGTVFGALIEAIDLSELARLDADRRARKSATSSTRSSRSRTS